MPLWGSKPKSPLILFQHVAKCGGTTLVEHLGQLGNRGLCLGFPCETKSDVRREAERLLGPKSSARNRVIAIYGHRVYYGLHELSEREPVYTTMLRHPVERVVSLFNHHAGIAHRPEHPNFERDRNRMLIDGELIDIADWLDRYYTGNHMVRFLYYAMQGEEVDPPGEMTEEHLAVAKQFLDLCGFVGTTETSDHDFAIICKAIGIAPPKTRANISTRYFDLGTGSSSAREAETNKLPEVTSQSSSIASLILERDTLDLELYQYACERRNAIGTNPSLSLS